MIGAYSQFYVAAVYLRFGYLSGGVGPLGAAVLGVNGILVGIWLSTVSILLFLDSVRHRVWGLLAAVSYATVFLPLFFFSALLTLTGLDTLTRLGALPAMIVPIIGFIGGIWGFFRKPSETAVTPKIITGKEPGRSWFPKDKPVIPALLSMAGNALPLFFLSIFIAALFGPPSPPPEGSVGPDFFFLLVPFLVGVAAILVILPVTVSILLLFEPPRHKLWGLILIIWWGPASFLTVAAVVGLVYGAVTWYTALALTPLLGLAGGVWGFFWHTGVNPRTWTPQTIAWAIHGQSGRVMVGGLAGIVCAIFASPALAILPSVLVVGNMLLGRSSVRSRARGVALMGLVVASALSLLAFEVVEYFNAWWEVVPRVAGLLGLVATILAGSGLVWSIRGPLIPRWKRLSTTVVFAVLVCLLVGSILAYAVVQIQARENLPQPNMSITNVGGTYVQDCGASGSQTTTFNMTWTVVNTGGNGLAFFGFDVNGQQVYTYNYGYYVHANSQLPLSGIFIVHACYGTQVPTYTVVLVSQQRG
jgi:hypothetical protein